mgnify:CR=1 FL=1
MTTIDLAPYSSYFSILTTVDSNNLSTGGSDDKDNVFLASNYSSFSADTVSSPDISLDSATGRIAVKATGTYLLTYIPTITVAGGTAAGASISKNGSEVFVSSNLTAFSNTDPVSITCQQILDLVVGDYLELKVSGVSTTAIVAENGTSFTMLKANGDYASIVQDADGSAGSANTLEVIGDQDLAGSSITTNLNNVTYATATGLLTPANSRPFLLLSTLMATSDTTSQETAIGIYANGLFVDGTGVLIHQDNDPNEESYGLMRSLTGGQTVSGRYRGGTGTAITPLKGTSFTAFDVSNNDGAGTPSAFISFAIKGDSDAQTTGFKNCFDEDLWSSYRTVVQSAETNITYTSSDGTFVVANAGRYFVLWNVVITDATTSTGRNFLIRKNGDSVFVTPGMVYTTYSPVERTVCLILDADAGDSFTFLVQAPRGKIADGTAISMFRVDDLEHLNPFFYDRPNTDLFDDRHAPEALIADDFTINSFSADGRSVQYNRAGSKQVPFTLGVPGPMSLRGKPTNTDGTPQNVSTGQKKN